MWVYTPEIAGFQKFIKIDIIILDRGFDTPERDSKAKIDIKCS